MLANRRVDTTPELRLRSELHRRGLRFRKDFRILLTDRVSVRPDIVFTRARVAVFVDGCFWHGCPDHFQMPRINRGYWEPKLARNVERDRGADAALVGSGWRVIRVWEHERTAAAAAFIEATVVHADRRLAG
jgi:DNA mismatch endonuclease (patch repair protein)